MVAPTEADATASTSAAGPPRRKRRVWFTLIASLFGGSALLWLASQWLDLWPDALFLPRPELLAVGCALYVPYVYARAVRLRFVLDPVVREAAAVGPDGGDVPRRLDWRILHGSGLFSFFVVLMLPLRLGELSRPLLLARSDAPGVDLPEAVGAIAVERALDGLIAVAMLFLGLSLATPIGDDPLVAERLAYVSQFGRLFGLIFAVALAVLMVVARKPGGPGRLVRALLGTGSFATRLAEIADKVGAALTPLWRPRQGVPFVLWSVAYWGVTVLQAWTVLLATGVEVGLAEAAATVAIVALSIQLPGGPAQAGSFQVGVAVALSLFAGPAVLATSGSSFAAVMYLVSLLGALAVFPVGALLLWLARRRPRHQPAEPAESAVRAP